MDVSSAVSKNQYDGVEAKRIGPKRTGLIPVIDRRLNTWGQWRLANDENGQIQSSCGSMLGALIAGGGEIIRSTDPSADSMPDDIFDTDRVVQKLEPKLRMVVEAQYMDLMSTRAEKGNQCGCSSKTFYNRLVVAHGQILFLLKSPLYKG